MCNMHQSVIITICINLSKSKNQCREVTEVFVLGVILAEGPQHYKKAARVVHCKKGFSLIESGDRCTNHLYNKTAS